LAAKQKGNQPEKSYEAVLINQAEFPENQFSAAMNALQNNSFIFPFFPFGEYNAEAAIFVGKYAWLPKHGMADADLPFKLDTHPGVKEFSGCGEPQQIKLKDGGLAASPFGVGNNYPIGSTSAKNGCASTFQNFNPVHIHRPQVKQNIGADRTTPSTRYKGSLLPSNTPLAANTQLPCLRTTTPVALPLKTSRRLV
jgi:hypothetical protein